MCSEDTRALGILGRARHRDSSSERRLDQLSWSGQEEEERCSRWEMLDMMGVMLMSVQGKILSKRSGTVSKV